jgi:hypothetical protein
LFSDPLNAHRFFFETMSKNRCDHLSQAGAYNGMNIKIASLGLACLLVFSSAIAGETAPSQDVGPSQSVSELRAMANGYHEAMVKKDKQALLGFFVDGSAPVKGVPSDTSYKFMVAANKKVAPTQIVPRFMAFPAQVSVDGDVRPDAPAEQVTNLRIATDGAIGTVTYDYSVPAGHGTEIWTVVRAEGGWKIMSIAYSLNLASLDKKS